MTAILAIDPGTTQSGFVVFEDGRVRESGVSPNDHILERVRMVSAYVSAKVIGPIDLVIERMEARGMPLGEDSIETIVWTGRFQQAWHRPDRVHMIKRRDVKQALCGSAKAKDANIRQALIDMLGAPGTKKAPGPTYGVSSHAWAALAVAVTHEQAKDAVTC